jgi:hypothetical protein
VKKPIPISEFYGTEREFISMRIILLVWKEPYTSTQLEVIQSKLLPLLETKYIREEKVPDFT